MTTEERERILKVYSAEDRERYAKGGLQELIDKLPSEVHKAEWERRSADKYFIDEQITDIFTNGLSLNSNAVTRAIRQEFRDQDKYYAKVTAIFDEYEDLWVNTEFVKNNKSLINLVKKETLTFIF